VVSSAFVISRFAEGRGYAKVLAAIVGGLAFPVLPVAWQIWGERRRTRSLVESKQTSKSQLTSIDRYWFRFAGVTLLIVGPMVAMQGFDVARAAIKHGTWFLPAAKPGVTMVGSGERRNLDRLDPLLERVPADAETVVVYAPTDVKGAGLIAFNQRDVMAVGQGEVPRDANQLRRINAVFKAQHVVPADPIESVLDRDDSVAASERWRSKVEPAPKALSPTLRRELERAPKLATAFAAYAPLHATSVRTIAAWLVERDHVVEVRIEAIDVAHAYAVVHAIEDWKAGTTQVPLAGDCKAAATKLLAKVEPVQYANIVTLRATVNEDFTHDLDRCTN
jgi:hypothetical protein